MRFKQCSLTRNDQKELDQRRVELTCETLVPDTSLKAAAASVSVTVVPFKVVRDFKRPITRRKRYSAYTKCTLNLFKTKSVTTYLNPRVVSQVELIECRGVFS